MKKEVIYVPKDKNFLEFIEEIFGEKIVGIWLYIDKTTIDILSKKEAFPYLDSKGKLHIAYGNIIIDGYRFENYSWYKIGSLVTENVTYQANADPQEIFFISIQ